MLRVGGDGAQRLRRRPEQDVVHHGLVLECDDLDLRRHGEHDVEIGHVEQFRLAVLQPLHPRQTLALRAIAVTTRVEGDALMAAIAALLNVAAERGGAAGFDCGHGTPLCRGQ
jgi:GAF domain-containing protein